VRILAGAFPTQALIEQDSHADLLDAALRQLSLADGGAGFVADVFGAASGTGTRAGRPRRGARQVGSGAGDPAGSGANGDFFGLLRGDHYGAGGIQRFFALLGAGKVAIGGNAGAVMVVAEERVERVADLLQQVVLDFLAIIEGCLRSLFIGVGGGTAEQVALHIEDGDGIRR
jgi:hypothetical protein